MSLPERAETTLYFHADMAEHVTVLTWEDDGSIWGPCIGETTLELDVPRISRAEIVKKQVSRLEQEKQELRARTQVGLNELDEKIQKLLALENDRETG